MDYKEKIDQLNEQMEQAKTLFIKCQGAIEMLTGMQEEENVKAVETSAKKSKK